MWTAIDYELLGPASLFTTAGACELLKKLEEIFVRASQGAGEDYLAVLSRIIKGGEKESLRRLMTVRLALARYFARCTIIGVGRSIDDTHRGRSQLYTPTL